MYPAPTLAEILDKLENFPKFYTTLYCGSDYHGPKWYTVVLYKLYKETPPHKWIKTSEGVGKSATNAALEVWLMFNKKPEKNNG